MKEHKLDFQDIITGPFPDYEGGVDVPVVGVITENNDQARIVLKNWAVSCAQGLPLCEIIDMLDEQAGQLRSGKLA